MINAGVSPTQDKIREVKLSKDKINDGDFDIFWKHYPRKVNKREARMRWKNKKHPPINIIIEIIEKHKKTEQWMKDNGKFIPHPSTWLNQESWEDEAYVKPEPKKEYY